MDSEPLHNEGGTGGSGTAVAASFLSGFLTYTIVVPLGLFIVFVLFVYLVRSDSKKSHGSLSCDTSSHRESSESVGEEEPSSPGSISAIKRVISGIRRQ